MSVMVTALLGIALNAQLVATLPRLPLPKAAPNVTRATVHQNRVAAARLDGRALRLAIDVVESAWRPQGNDASEVPLLAFAERGRTPSVPGPLIRAREGTEIVLSIRNTSDSALVIEVLRPGPCARERYAADRRSRVTRADVHAQRGRHLFLLGGVSGDNGG